MRSGDIGFRMNRGSLVIIRDTPSYGMCDLEIKTTNPIFTMERIQDWWDAKGCVQDMSFLSIQEMEFLITGIPFEEQTIMFAPPEY